MKCSECVFGLEQPRKDCILVDENARFRSLVVVARRWRAASEVGCDDFFPLADLEQVEAFARARGNQRAVDEFVDIRRRRGLGA